MKRRLANTPLTSSDHPTGQYFYHRRFVTAKVVTDRFETVAVRTQAKHRFDVRVREPRFRLGALTNRGNGALSYTEFLSQGWQSLPIRTPRADLGVLGIGKESVAMHFAAIDFLGVLMCPM